MMENNTTEVPQPSSVMEPIEDPSDLEDVDDEQVHDQLPSVEEAKANVQLDDDTNPTRRTKWCRRCLYCGGCLCCTFILLFILVMVVGYQESKELESTRNHKNWPEDGIETLAPGTFDPRVEYVRNYLSAFSDMEQMLREGSPQNRASKWIADQDILHIPMDDPTFIERYALAVLYFAMNGPNWEHHLGFLSPLPPCSWYHIGFGSDDKPRYVGAHCKTGQKVQELFFPEKWLRGDFPDELRLLEELTYISVYRNPDIGSEFPSAIRNIPKLEYLAMHFCDLEGTIPSWIGELTSLTSLILSNNDLTGTLPTAIGNLTGLTQLFLDDNRLEGDIKVLEPLEEIQALLLEDNQFHGSLDDPMMYSWQHLEIMDLSNNNLTSTIPPGFFALKNLSVADLHSNQMTGSLPEVSTVNDALKFFAIHENNFEGQIPSSFARLQKLSHLDMTSNIFTGTIPDEFANMTDMKYLFLAMNPFVDAKIPTFLQSLTKLEDLSLKATSRTGAIPRWVGLMPSLVLLDLDTNKLTGTIDRSLGELPNLKFLLLNANKLTGTIPASFKNLTKLDFLMVEKNSLTGTAKHVCDEESVKPQVFSADCDELQCPCCTLCCSDSQTVEQCDDQVWLGGVDPIWETKYERTFYQFEKVEFKQREHY